MGNKLMLSLIGILMPCLLCGQEKIKDPIFYDAINHLPVFRLYKIDEKIKVDYYYNTLDTINSIDVNIGFIGGGEYLRYYCVSLYYVDADEYDYRELNIRVPYSILFNNELKIQEIHIIERPAPYNNCEYNKKYNYNDLIKRILFSTEGKWIKKDKESHDWYMYVGLFHLK